MSSLRPYNSSGGFSLIEILVVVALVSILAMVGIANFSGTYTSARDAERQTDLKNLQNAIETYKNRVGRYPAGCAVGAGANGWSGQLGTNYACSDGTGQYIVGLAPEYIPVLPTDPKLNGVDSGYIYRTNTEGTVYKLKAYKTVEGEVVTRNHPLKPCDVRVEQNAGGAPLMGNRDPRVIGWCAAFSDGASFSYSATVCNENDAAFSSSYGVWGGQAALNNIYNQNIYAADPLEQISGGNEQQKNLFRLHSIKPTTDVICQ